MKTIYQKIILPTRPQPDTIVAIFLLREFGKEKYPGLEEAELEIRQELPKNETENSLREKGVLILDIGKGKFDHHFRGKTVSQLVAQDLEVEQNPAIKKLLTYAERDDKYGLGTISSDQIDKTFGLSGLISSLNKTLTDNPREVVEIVLLLLRAHYSEERKRAFELPKEFKEKLEQGKAEVFEIKQGRKKLKVVVLESNNLSMIGWLRSSLGLRADVICQKVSSGYVNIVTRPLKRIDLRWLIAYLRNEEAKLNKLRLKYLTYDLMRPGKILEIPNWYYDRATNSILNGGTNPKGISPTIIPFETIKEILKKALEQTPPKRVGVQNSKNSKRLSPKQYFLEIRLPLEKAKEIRENLIGSPVGIKFHEPKNYHITLMYLGALSDNALATIELVRKIIEDFKPFEIVIDTKNFKSGIVTGYSNKAFYFDIKNQQSKEFLEKIRQQLKQTLPNLKNQEFSAHLTVASAIPQINEKVIEKSEIKLDKEKRVKLLIEKIRLTEIIKKPSGQTVYKIKKEFDL